MQPSAILSGRVLNELPCSMAAFPTYRGTTEEFGLKELGKGRQRGEERAPSLLPAGTGDGVSPLSPRTRRDAACGNIWWSHPTNSNQVTLEEGDKN